MKIKTFNKNSMGQNIYLCYCDAKNEGILVDAGCSSTDIASLSSFVNTHGINILAILLTHGHYDHLTGLDTLRVNFDAPVYAHQNEVEFLQDPDLNLSCKTSTNIVTNADFTFTDGDKFTFGNCQLSVLHTPGHTPGGVCYYEKASGSLLTGDTLFKNTIGRTDLPGGDHKKLVKNIKTKLLVLPTDTIVYPGHGDITTIGAELESNQYL